MVAYSYPETKYLVEINTQNNSSVQSFQNKTVLLKIKHTI